MTAYAELVALADAQYPDYPIEYPDGVTINLRSVLDLNDDEMEKFQASQEKLTELDESTNMAALRSEFVDVLTLVSNDQDQARDKFGAAPLKFLVTVFKEYTKLVSDAAKSEDSAPATS